MGPGTGWSSRAGRRGSILRRGRPGSPQAFRALSVFPRGLGTAEPLLVGGFTAGSAVRGRLCPHMGWGGEGKARGAGGRGCQGRCPGTARRLAAGRVGRRLGAATASGREAGQGCGRR